MNREIYDRNIAAIRERFPEMAEAIERQQYQVDEGTEVTVEQAMDGTPILVLRREKRCLYLNGKREPAQIAKRMREKWGDLNRETPIYVVGMGDVATMMDLLENTDSNIHIMVYEPSMRVFLTLLQEVDITLYFTNRTLGLVIRGLNEKELRPVIGGLINLGNVSFLKIYVSPNYRELFPEETRDFLKQIDELSTKVISNWNTGIRFQGVHAKNLFHNVGYLCDGYITTQLCEVIPRDIPAIVVSAGPSLNKNIHQLKKAKNKAFIVAVDTAVKPLVRAGIVPDLYVMVDGLKPMTLFDFDEAKKIPLMTSMTSAWEVLRQHTGKKIFYNEGEQLVYNLLAMNGIPFSTVSCGGSVACSAFSLVYKLGFSRIILVGQDLALTGNKTHADGTFQDKMEEIDTSRYQLVEGNDGTKVPTRGDFKLYLDWFNYYIAGCEGIHVINATEGGAKIQNTEIMKLSDAIDRECHREVDIEECFDKLKPILDGEQRARAIEYLNSVPEKLLTIKKEALKGKRQYQKLRNICKRDSMDTTAYLQILNKIKKNTKKIEGHELFSIVSSTLRVAEYMISSEQYYEEKDRNEEGLEIARKGIQYMDLVVQCIDEVLVPLAEETVGKLR